MGFIQLGFNFSWVASSGILSLLIFLFEVLIVEFCVDIVLIVHPGTDLVGVLLVEVPRGGDWVDENVFAVEANMVSLQSFVSPKHHLTPQVRVLPTLVHGGVWLEVLLNEVLILVKSSLDLFVAGIILEDLIEVSSHGILLLMEPVEVHSFDGVDMHGHKLAEGTPKEIESNKVTYL